MKMGTLAVDFTRERHWWDAKACSEEQDLADERINRALRWREIERHLAGVETILEIGAGTGRFSIPLARRGFRVTHLDFSPAMLEIARRHAQGVAGISFVQANVADLSRFSERAFDLVLNMDGAISFCGSQAFRALQESCRVAGSKLIVSVSHRAQMVAVLVAESLKVSGGFLPAVEAMLATGEWHTSQFPENLALARGATQDYFGAMKAFLADELRAILVQAGLLVLRCGGLGSLASLCGPETVERLLADERLLEPFLDLCERFDRYMLPDGPGTRQRAGLIAVAERPT
jgi:ubiquinone/menaquinone biosynthesis C-methylase UbiE